MKKSVMVTFAVLGALTLGNSIAARAAERCGTLGFEKWLSRGNVPQEGFILRTTNGQNYVFARDNSNPYAAQYFEEQAQVLSQALGKNICVFGKIFRDSTGCFGNHNEIITDFKLAN